MYLTTFSNHRIDFKSPHISQIKINDIARSLSRLPRYCGHTLNFYSVAQHCVLVANKILNIYNVDNYATDKVKKIALAGLLHEVSECYGVNDIHGTLKRSLGWRARQKIHAYEKKLLEEIGFTKGELPDIVDYVDSQLLVDELKCLFRTDHTDGVDFKDNKKYGSCKGFGDVIIPWDIETSYDTFLKMFKKLDGFKLTNITE